MYVKLNTMFLFFFNQSSEDFVHHLPNIVIMSLSSLYFYLPLCLHAKKILYESVQCLSLLARFSVLSEPCINCVNNK